MFLYSMEYILLQKNQNKYHHYFVCTRKSNELQYQSIYQDLLYMLHALGYYQEDNLTHPMLITALLSFFN